MWTDANLPDIVRREELTKRAIEQGLFTQVVDESLATLRNQPYDLHAVESMLRAQWKAGDTLGALRSIRRALELNPHEPGYRFMRGLLHQSVGMVKEAMSDFEAALTMADSESLRDSITAAMRGLEDWQLNVVQMLLAEDRTFRLEFSADPHAAVEKKGFALTAVGSHILPYLKPQADPGVSAGLS